MSLFGRSKKCEFCGEKKATRKVRMEDLNWKFICERCWMDKKITPYNII